MHITQKRTALLCTAVLLCTTAFPCSAQESVNDDGYDLSGFAWQWPEVFSKDDTVTITENTYQSHDISITMTKVVRPTMTGDADCDSTVTVSDAVLLSKCLAEQSGVEITYPGLRNADSDYDSILTAADLSRLICYLTGGIAAEDFIIQGDPLVYHTADVYVRYIDSFRSAYAGGTFPKAGSLQIEPVKKMANDNNALFAINADFVSTRYVGIVRRNGVLYRDTKFRDEICVLYRDGVMDVLTDAEYRALPQETLDNIWQTSHFYLGLVKDDEVISGFEGSVAAVNPRSGLGYYEPGHYLFLQVDGRQEGYSTGLTLDEYAKLFQSFGVHEAYNMDGGSSSEIIFNGATYNLPAPVHAGDAFHGRSSSDIFYICEPSQIPEDVAAIAWEAAGGLAGQEGN